NRSGNCRNGLFVFRLLTALSQASGTSSMPSDRWYSVVRSFSDSPWIVPWGLAAADAALSSSPDDPPQAQAVATSSIDATAGHGHVRDFMVGESSMALIAPSRSIHVDGMRLIRRPGAGKQKKASRRNITRRSPEQYDIAPAPEPRPLYHSRG